ncbi:MAG TPA: hypothetical protein PK826_11595 [Anaerolineae bacterium]|nr:hypothetical protein [Anaerolineae bacterium]HRA20400.1 hypothetical protein [Anaerolineae bacterium]
MTTCIHPPALVEPLLLRALDGDVDAATAAHLATCPHCRQALDQLAQEDRLLRQRLNADPCPPRATLAAWSDGELPDTVAAAVDAHATGCAVCRADLVELAAFRHAALDVAGAMDQALTALQPERRGMSSASGPAHNPLAGLRRVLAAFQAPQALPAALRSRGSTVAMTSSYSADEGRVIVSCVVRPGAMPGRYRLSGRVHGLDLRRIALRDATGLAVAEADLDDHGAFRLPELPGGPLLLRFDGPGLVLDLDRPVNLGPLDLGPVG